LEKRQQSLLDQNDKVTRNSWTLTLEQEQFLSDNWRVLDDYALAEMLGTTRDGVQKLRARRGFMHRGRNAVKAPKVEVPIILWVLRDTYEELEEAKAEVNLKLGE